MLLEPLVDVLRHITFLYLFNWLHPQPLSNELLFLFFLLLPLLLHPLLNVLMLLLVAHILHSVLVYLFLSFIGGVKVVKVPHQIISHRTKVIQETTHLLHWVILSHLAEKVHRVYVCFLHWVYRVEHVFVS